MIQQHSVTKRFIVGVTTGAIIGLISMFLFMLFGFSLFSMFGLGTLLLFVFMGMVTAFVGQFDRHPIFHFKISWCLRGIVIGIGFMLMYVLLTYPTLEIMMRSSIIAWTGMTSPFWVLIDGFFIGLLMSYLETKIAGEGSELPLE
jgi:hypothetical protein